jgi:hypothetical protein
MATRQGGRRSYADVKRKIELRCRGTALFVMVLVVMVLSKLRPSLPTSALLLAPSLLAFASIFPVLLFPIALLSLPRG